MYHSYKKGSSRPVTFDCNRTQTLKALFAVRMTKILKKDPLLINVDEASFGRLTKNNYSWLPIGVTGTIKNAKIVGS